MFYSTEVLSSRQYGIATIWLAATLGSKSHLRRINRKAILEVDIPKACETIVNPADAMALRLQGNLLYGLSRVYSRQCTYVLGDVQSTHSAMIMMMKVTKFAELDPEAGRVRPDQLVLQDDPSFMPDAALLPPDYLSLANLNLPGLDLPIHSGESQSLTPCTPFTPDTPELSGFNIRQSSSSSARGGFAWIPMGSPTPEVTMGAEAVELLPEAEFAIDAEGNMMEILGPTPQVGARPVELFATDAEDNIIMIPGTPEVTIGAGSGSAMNAEGDMMEIVPDTSPLPGGENIGDMMEILGPTPPVGAKPVELFATDAEGNIIIIPGTPEATMGAGAESAMNTEGDMREIVSDTSPLPLWEDLVSDTAAGRRVSQGHEEAQRATDEAIGDEMDIDRPVLGDEQDTDRPALGDEMAVDEPALGEDDRVTEVNPPVAAAPSAEPRPSSPPEDESQSIARAEIRRRKRVPKALPFDNPVELQTEDLANWRANYLVNMEQAAKIKAQHKAITQAKHNAEYWIWTSGIGNIGRRFGPGPAGHPFDIFYGDQLFEAITRAGTKRDHDSGIDDATQAESRRVRPRLEEEPEHGPELGRAGSAEEEPEHEPESGGAHSAEEEFAPALGEDEGADIELPRAAQTPLQDQQNASAMPWNVAASVRGSSTARRRPPEVIYPPSRGTMGTTPSDYTTIHGPDGIRMARYYVRSEFNDTPSADNAQTPDADEGEPWPQFDSATPPPPPFRVPLGLADEDRNFLEYVSDTLGGKRKYWEDHFNAQGDYVQAEVATRITEVLFDELVPPDKSTKAVAANGLMLVLSLGSRGLLDVRQDVHFGEIGISYAYMPGEWENWEYTATEAATGEGADDVDDDGLPELPPFRPIDDDQYTLTAVATGDVDADGWPELPPSRPIDDDQYTLTAVATSEGGDGAGDGEMFELPPFTPVGGEGGEEFIQTEAATAEGGDE